MAPGKNYREHKGSSSLLLTILSEDLITFILLKLPVKSLLILTSVCKYLWTLITSPSFTKFHIDHQNNHHNNNLTTVVVGYFPDPVLYRVSFGASPCSVGDVEEMVYPFSDNLKFESRGSCNGLLLVEATRIFGRGRNRMPIIWNPVTDECIKLPHTPIDYPGGGSGRTHYFCHYYGFGYDHSTDDYKVVRCTVFRDVRHHGLCNWIMKVYSLRSNSWKRFPSTRNPYKSYVCERCLPLVFNGVFHWPMRSEPSTAVVIVTFAFTDQKFQELPQPATILNEDTDTRGVQVLRGCLCLIQHNYEKVAGNYLATVWMMSDYGVEGSWTKLCTIVEPCGLINEAVRRYIKLLRLCENGEILMVNGTGQNAKEAIAIYDPDIDVARKCLHNTSLDVCDFQIETYVESLVSLNSGTYMGTRLPRHVSHESSGPQESGKRKRS